MTIKNIVWGSDNGGVACGPVSGSNYVEITVEDDNKECYVLVSEYCAFYQARIAEESLFGYAIDNNWSESLKKMDTLTKHQYDWEMHYDADEECEEDLDEEEYRGSRFESVIQFGEKLLSLYSMLNTEEEDAALEMIKDYNVGNNGNHAAIPARLQVKEKKRFSKASEDVPAEKSNGEVMITTIEELFKYRLSFETDIETDSVYHLDAINFQGMKDNLKMLKSVCQEENCEEEYQAWKNTYIEDEYEKCKKQKFLTCSYVFAGMGQYEAVIPADGLESFKCWINSNGSAIYGGDRESTEDEVKRFIALNANKN